MTTSSAPAERTRRTARPAVVYPTLAVVLVLAVLVSAMLGQVAISPSEVIGSLLRAVGIDNAWAPTAPEVDATLWLIRFPRIAMAVLVGVALAVAGVVMQAIFGNPLAEPGVVGVSSGAALGASASIALGLSFLGSWTTPVFALVAGLATTLFVYYFSRSGGRTEVVTLLLTGIAVNAFSGAGLALFTFAGSASAREQIVFWQLGSLNGSRWEQVLIVAVGAAVGLTGSFIIARSLDLLSLGDRSARHLGVNVEALRVTGIVLVAVLVGTAVAFAGIIAFVGLVVPHMMRMLLGPAHRSLLLASALGGALLLVLADLLARTAVPYADLPIGMITSLIGGPYFFYLLRRTRKQAGGWA